MTGKTKTRRLYLFERFPALEAAVPVVPLIDAPTPVQPLEKIGRRLGREVWIKRDDLTSTVYGGNKPRKLEFILADAQKSGKKELVTGGGLGTNHGLATLIHSRDLGFSVRLLLFHQPVNQHVRQTLKLFHAMGANIHYAGGLYPYIFRFFVTEKLRRRNSYFVEPGGSCALSTLGYVEAALEIVDQIEKGEMPEPETAYVAAGTCGTLAGLALGFKLAGLKTRVIGIRVATPLSANVKTAVNLARGANRLMQKIDPSVPDTHILPDDVQIDCRHYGPGYGVETEDCKTAYELMLEAEGLRLDTTYTAKAFGGLCHCCRIEETGGPALFVNTFNSIDLSNLAADVAPADLPTEFHRFFE